MVDLVQNGEQTFLDQNGNPLAGGAVYMYAPNTGIFSDTWKDSGGTVLNTNPIILDQAGRAVIWGLAQYRQVVTDQFGNVQWDRIAQAGVSGGDIIGDLSINGNLRVTGTSTLLGPVSAGLITANAGIISNGEISISPGQVLVAGGLIYANGGIQSGGEIHIMPGQLLVADGLINANAGIVSGGEISITPGNVLVVNDVFAQPGATILLFHSSVVVQDDAFGNAKVRVVGGNNPIFAMGNTALSTNGGMWNAGPSITWGTTDGAGNSGSSLMNLRITGAGTGNLSISGDVTPYTNEGSSLGEVGVAWNNVVAHNYITVSTQVDSEPAGDGFLDMVKGVAVKTAPHLGLAKEDLAGHDWAQIAANGGVNYNMVVGALWKALQELSAKFDAYVAAHP